MTDTPTEIAARKLGAIGLAVHRNQTYTRDCVRYRGYIDNE